MNTPDLVTVFYFSKFEFGSDALAMSSYKATRETIEKTHKGKVLEGTGEKVPRDAVDGEGRYRRVATGWGELPST
jgi:hypothetical protein